MTQDDKKTKMQEITERLEAGVKELFESERYKEYLKVMSKFHNYSFNNTMLIALQKPDATLIAGYAAWKKNFDRNVKKGEKGIRIIAPSPYKIKVDAEKIDPNTQKPFIGEDGKPVMEEKEITIPAFKLVTVFDVSQTEGKELPDLSVNELTGDVEEYKDFYAALERTSPFAMGFEVLSGSTKGCCYYKEQRIAINKGMSELQNIKTAIHEIAHAKRHNFDLDAPTRPDRQTREVEAESIAYSVCQSFGLDTSDYSFNYIAGWSSGRELTELKGSLETIRVTAAEIINTMEEHLAALRKEREVAKEMQTDFAAEPTPTKNEASENSKESVMNKLLTNKALIERQGAKKDAMKHIEHEQERKCR